MTMLIDPVMYLGETADEIFSLIEKVAKEGEGEDFGKLEKKVDWAISLREGLTAEEKKAVDEILSDTYIEFLRTGGYLAEIKKYIFEAKELIDEGEDKEYVLMGIFGEGVYALSDQICNGIEEEGIDMHDYFGKI